MSHHFPPVAAFSLRQTRFDGREALLERILRCGHSLISLVLSGKRELSKDNVRALAKHFKLSADYFL